MMKWDHKLFFYVFGLSLRYPRLGAIMTAVTKLSSKLFEILYGAFIVILVGKRDRNLLFFLAAPASALCMVQIIRTLFPRPRPFIALHIHSLVAQSSSSSFPSRHSTSAFVIACSLFFLYPSWGILALCMASITGLSRVMVGVHYPTDILSGALLGIGISHLAFFLTDHFIYRFL